MLELAFLYVALPEGTLSAVSKICPMPLRRGKDDPLEG